VRLLKLQLAMFPDVRRVRVSAWHGICPAPGDQLRSRRARYLIVHVEANDAGRPTAFHITRVKAGSVEGGNVHPWVWDRRGRFRATQQR
jgi:hypothetical protein